MALDEDAIFERWRSVAAGLGFVEFVSASDGFACLTGTKRAWRSSSRTGIYCWIARNGEAYVGQARSVRRRLMAHCKSYDDIVFAAFKRTRRADLDATEQAMISSVEKHFRIRNIKHAQRTARSVPFDALVGGEEQKRFLDGEVIGGAYVWQELPDFARKTQHKFRRLSEHPDYQSILTAVRIFIERAIPKPDLTEVNHWSISVLPAGNLVRISCGQQEVFTAYLEGGDLCARPLAILPLDDSAVEMTYKIKSYDHSVPISDFSAWLQDDRRLACRDLVVRLARQTTALNSGSHCPQLVRAAFS